MLRNTIVLYPIIKNPTQAHQLGFKIHLQKFNKKTQMSPSALCMIGKDLSVGCYLNCFVKAKKKKKNLKERMR